MRRKWTLNKPIKGVKLNPGHPLTRGLVSCWLFNEGSGDKIFDLSGQSNNGIVYGGGWLGITSAHLDSHCGDSGSHDLTEALDGTDFWEHSVEETHWFIIDLGKTYYVTQVAARSESAQDPTNVNIYVSDDKENFGAAVASGISTWQDTDTWAIVDTTDKLGRYVKVEITATEQGEGGTLQFGVDPRAPMFNVAVLDISPWVPGKFGSALDFTGVAEYVDVGDNTDFEFINDLTISAWVKSSASANRNMIVSKWDAEIVHEREYFLEINSDSDLRAYFSTDGTFQVGNTIDGVATVSDGKWHHVALVYNATDAILYVDGNEDNKTAGFGALYNGDAKALIGAEGSAFANKFNGEIDNVMIWKRALTSSEIQQLFREPFAMFERQEIVFLGVAVPSEVVVEDSIMSYTDGFVTILYPYTP